MFLSQDDSVGCTVDALRVFTGQENQLDHPIARSVGNGTPHGCLDLRLVMDSVSFVLSRYSSVNNAFRVSNAK